VRRDIISVPILIHTDGVKNMDHSTGDHIAVIASPETTFCAVTSLPDTATGQFFPHLTEPGPISRWRRTVAAPWRGEPQK
jgi:hypothetical protein